MTRRPPSSPPFPYPPLSRSLRLRGRADRHGARLGAAVDEPVLRARPVVRREERREPAIAGRLRGRDRKSTRLNSSHANISYAVFCLKKKNHTLIHLHYNRYH